MTRATLDRLLTLTCKVGSEGVVRLRVVHEANKGLDDLLCLGGRLPVLGRHDRETHLTLLVNVGVVDLGSERHLRRLEGILWREHQVD